MRRVFALFLAVWVLATGTLQVCAAEMDLEEWALPFRDRIHSFSPGKPYVAYYLSHPGPVGSAYVFQQDVGFGGTCLYAVVSDTRQIGVGDSVTIYWCRYQDRLNDFSPSFGSYTPVRPTTIVKGMHVRSDDGRYTFEPDDPILEGCYWADYYLEDVSSAVIDGTYEMPSGHVLRLWDSPDPPPNPEAPPAVSPEVLESVMDAVTSSVAVVLPASLTLFAIFLCIRWIPYLLRKYAK